MKTTTTMPTVTNPWKVKMENCTVWRSETARKCCDITFDSNQKSFPKLYEGMDTFQMNPKAIRADMAFHHPHDMQVFYRMHNVKRLPTGPHTTWPNRADMGVRLSKKFLSALVDPASERCDEKGFSLRLSLLTSILLTCCQYRSEHKESLQFCWFLSGVYYILVTCGLHRKNN